MLQIISGKFFKGGEVRAQEGHGITYSNLWWPQAVHTCVATLHPVEATNSPGSIQAYVISYAHRLEERKLGEVQIVRVGDAEIVRQFELLCTFGLRSIFCSDRAQVELLCRRAPRSGADEVVPARFVDQFFDLPRTAVYKEVESFAGLVERVIGLPREVYKRLLTCLSNFSDALHIVGSNLDLAYSMVVYCVEALTQWTDRFDPSWEDYDQDIRARLDSLLEQAEPSLAASIREALLASAKLRAQKRFLSFVEQNTAPTFFTDEAVGRKYALRRSELVRAAQNAYRMRSGFVHELRPVQEQLLFAPYAKQDVVHWDNEPYLTFSGLVRLTRHVLMQFLSKQGSVETEDCDWMSELPGQMHVRLAPECWIARTDRFTHELAVPKLGGFLQQLQDAKIRGKPLTNLKGLMKVYEKEIPRADKRSRAAMLVTYLLYNSVAAPAGKGPGWQAFVDSQAGCLGECCIETLICHVLLAKPWPWSVNECATCYEDFQRRRHRKGALEIPPLTDLAILLELANCCKRSGCLQKADHWLDYAVGEAAGKPHQQELMTVSKRSRLQTNVERVFEAEREALSKES